MKTEYKMMVLGTVSNNGMFHLFLSKRFFLSNKSPDHFNCIALRVRNLYWKVKVLEYGFAR